MRCYSPKMQYATGRDAWLAWDWCDPRYSGVCEGAGMATALIIERL